VDKARRVLEEGLAATRGDEWEQKTVLQACTNFVHRLNITTFDPDAVIAALSVTIPPPTQDVMARALSPTLPAVSTFTLPPSPPASPPRPMLDVAAVVEPLAAAPPTPPAAVVSAGIVASPAVTTVPAAMAPRSSGARRVPVEVPRSSGARRVPVDVAEVPRSSEGDLDSSDASATASNTSSGSSPVSLNEVPFQLSCAASASPSSPVHDAAVPSDDAMCSRDDADDACDGGDYDADLGGDDGGGDAHDDDDDDAPMPSSTVSSPAAAAASAPSPVQPRAATPVAQPSTVATDADGEQHFPASPDSDAAPTPFSGAVSTPASRQASTPGSRCAATPYTPGNASATPAAGSARRSLLLRSRASRERTFAPLLVVTTIVLLCPHPFPLYECTSAINPLCEAWCWMLAAMALEEPVDTVAEPVTTGCDAQSESHADVSGRERTHVVLPECTQNLGSFVTVEPVPLKPREVARLGSPMALSPVRRSYRTIDGESGVGGAPLPVADVATVATVMMSTGLSYCHNKAVDVRVATEPPVSTVHIVVPAGGGGAVKAAAAAAAAAAVPTAFGIACTPRRRNLKSASLSTMLTLTCGLPPMSPTPSKLATMSTAMSAAMSTRRSTAALRSARRVPASPCIAEDGDDDHAGDSEQNVDEMAQLLFGDE
jgi:hypothetical protein